MEQASLDLGKLAGKGLSSAILQVSAHWQAAAHHQTLLPEHPADHPGAPGHPGLVVGEEQGDQLTRLLQRGRRLARCRQKSAKSQTDQDLRLQKGLGDSLQL